MIKHNHHALVLSSVRQSELLMRTVVHNDVGNKSRLDIVVECKLTVAGWGSLNLRDEIDRLIGVDFTRFSTQAFQLATSSRDFRERFVLGALVKGKTAVTKFAAGFHLAGETFTLFSQGAKLNMEHIHPVPFVPGTPKTTHTAHLTAPLIDFHVTATYDDVTGELCVTPHGPHLEHLSGLEMDLSVQLLIKAKPLTTPRVKKPSKV